MKKRKRLRTTGIYPTKPPKNPWPGDAKGGSPSSVLSGGSPTSAAPPEPSRQEPRLAVTSFPEQEETTAASLLGHLEKEAALLPPPKEALPSPSAPQLLEGSLGPGAWTPADSPHPMRSGQEPRSPVSGEGAAACSPEMAGQDPGAGALDGGDSGSPAPAGAQGLARSEGQLPCCGAEGTKPDHGAPQEAGAPPGTLGGGGGGGISSTPVPTPTLATLCMKAWAPTPRGAGGSASASLGTAVTADTGTDAPRTDPGALGVAPPASPREQTPWGCRSLSEETPGDQGEAGREKQPPRDTPESPAPLQGTVLRTPEPALDTQDPALGLGPGGDHTWAPGPAVEWPGMVQLEDTRAVESGGQHLGGGHREPSTASEGPFQEARACQGGPKAATPPLDPVSQAGCLETLAMELDFLPDSQLRAALDAPGLEAPAEQDGPTGDQSGLCWPSPGPAQGDRVPEAEAQPRMEDASDTVRGLIVELSNLNRLIMSAHRDLDACRRLGPRKAWPPPCPARGAATRDQRPWWDV